MNRMGQFFRAVFARISKDDAAYIRKHLSPGAQELFFGMNLADQYHALQVAYTAECLADAEKEPLDREFLIRCALLHDVGRGKGDMGILGKVAAVLLHDLFPKRSRKWANPRCHHFYEYPGYMMYVYYYHPVIGAEKLLAAGFGEEAEVVRLHHRPLAEEDSLVLRILKQADGMN